LGYATDSVQCQSTADTHDPIRWRCTAYFRQEAQLLQIDFATS